MRGRLRVGLRAGVVLGVILGSLLVGTVEAQGPYSAQIQRAINALRSGGLPFTGNLLFSPDNTYDIGANGASRPRNIFAGTNITASNTFSVAGGGNFNFNGRSVLASSGDGLLQVSNNAATGFTRLILGTNDATANGASLVLSAGALIASTGDGSARANLVANAITVGSANGFIASSAGKITTYSGVTTAGWGVPSIVSAGRSTAQTAAVGSVATYTVGAADGSFEVSANVLVTTATSHSFGVSVTYTDEGNTSRTSFFSFYTAAGYANGATAVINANGAVAYAGVVNHIRAKAGTTITIASSGTFTTVTYNVEGSIRQIS